MYYYNSTNISIIVLSCQYIIELKIDGLIKVYLVPDW